MASAEKCTECREGGEDEAEKGREEVTAAVMGEEVLGMVVRQRKFLDHGHAVTITISDEI
jgi:hypothetical protein